MVNEQHQHFTLWNVGSQQLHVAFDGGCIVSDAGLLAVRALEKPLRVLADLAQRLPDPRSPKFIEHSVEAILTQEVYQILAGYPDFNDAHSLRVDPLFQILADVSPDADNPLASPSTLSRFQYAFTRRQAELPLEDRPVLREIRAAQTGRIKILNAYLVDLFVRTRRTPPTEIILDVDASDAPVHGRQTLSGYHGYYRQHQYLPLFVYDGATGFPLAAWLRPGTVHASLGAAEILDTIVTRLRATWPDLRLQVRSDNGLAVPGLYDYCEAHGLSYAFGYATNPVLQRATDQALADVELYHHFYRHREPVVQRFESLTDYQADSWPHPRRIVVKIEVTPQGSQRRFVVTDHTEPPAVVYRDFYVQRGKVPEQPIGEMKNGLQADRLSACGFCANAFRLLVHTLAYAIVVLFREAVAAVPEVATASVSTLRQRLWKLGAVVVTGVRRIWFHLSETWPYRDLWGRVLAAVQGFVQQVATG
ncbi:MAG: IS1380 family transposase [Mycobacterium sp.]|nr:IS1380 family transposase [Mycobacterium sp.]